MVWSLAVLRSYSWKILITYTEYQQGYFNNRFNIQSILSVPLCSRVAGFDSQPVRRLYSQRFPSVFLGSCRNRNLKLAIIISFHALPIRHS